MPSDLTDLDLADLDLADFGNSAPRALVTGGAGYIGAHVCKALRLGGWEPIVCDNLSTGHAYAVQWGALERCDIADRAALALVFERHRPQAVLHFAACSLVGDSVRDPAAYFRNNVAGTLTLLEVMRDAGVDRLVFSSSCAVYGDPNLVPISEAEPVKPMNPYGDSKAMVETIIRRFSEAYGLRASCLRYFNAAGADLDGEIGEDHDPETHLIPLAIDVALGRRARIEIFGSDYDTPDGTCIRDYVHVADLAQAHLLALEALEKSDGVAVFNLGNGGGFSVRQVIEAVARVTGRAVSAMEADRRPGDPPVLISDAAKARSVLKWTPKITELEAIVRSAWRWRTR